MTARRAAIYARVSTGDQTCENQLLCLREVAERAGWTVVQEYVETASGASEARPELARARNDATRRRYDVLVVWDASRLARSLRVLLNLAHDLESLGIGLHLHQEAIDTTTPSGRLLFQVRGMVAELERSIIVERTKAGLARARSQGKRLGRPPASDALVAAIRNLRSRGMGMDRIARELRCGKGLSQKVCTEFDAEQREAAQ